MKIAGQRRGEVYPEAPRASSSGGGPLVRAGFDNSVEAQVYSGADQTFVVQRGTDIELSVPLTGSTSGNIVFWQISLRTQDGIASGPAGYQIDVLPWIDVGIGKQPLDTPPAQMATYGGVFPLIWSPWVVMAFYRPTVEELLQDPVVGAFIQVISSPDSAAAIRQQGAMLYAAEYDAAFVTKMPATTLLAPIP